MACYAENPKQHVPPRELIQAFRSKNWGLPYTGGWMAQPAGMVDRMNACLNVYSAFRAYSEADDIREFIERNPSAWRIIEPIEARRMKR